MIKKNDLINLFWLYAFLVGLHVATPTSQASDAFVSADGEFGQGYFRKRGSECFFVTPAHVVEDAGEIFLTTESRKEIGADLFTIFPGDIAVLKANLKVGESCPRSTWGDGRKLPSLLDIFEIGFIVTRLEDGSTLKTEVKIQGFDKFSTIKITSINPKIDISKGFSGSPLFIADRAAGMLLSVNDGTGLVTRQDTLNNYLALFFAESTQQDEDLPKVPIKKEAETIIPSGDQTAGLDVKTEETVKGKIASGARAEYLFKGEKNSPLEIRAPKIKWGVYRLNIFLQGGSDALYSGKVYGRGSNFAFTPPETGTYKLQLIGEKGHGSFEVRITQLTTNTQLTGQANVVKTGETVKGKIASGAWAEYLFKGEKNSPLEIRAPKIKWGVYRLNIFLQGGSDALYSGKVYGRGSNFAFTPPETGTYKLQLIGEKGHGSFEVRLKNL